MKRWVSLLLAIVICLSLAACGGEMGTAPEQTALHNLNDMVVEGSGEYIVPEEYPMLFTERLLDDESISRLQNKQLDAVRAAISTPADFAAWLDTQQAQYYSNVICNDYGQRRFGTEYSQSCYGGMLFTPAVAGLAAYILGDDIPGMGMVAVNMAYGDGLVLCGNVFPVDDGYYVFSLDCLSQRWQETAKSNRIMKEVFPLIQITGLSDLIPFCGGKDDISSRGGTPAQGFYFLADQEIVMDLDAGYYIPQDPSLVIEFYRNDACFAAYGAEGAEHIKPENIGSYCLSDLLGGTTLTAEEAYELLDMEPEQVKERVKTAADVLMYMLAANIGDCGGCYCDEIDGQIWHSNLSAFGVMEQRLSNCGASANLANYLLEGDYEEVGFILHGYYIGQGGGHVYNYIRHEGKYYIVDFSWYIFNGYRPENDFPVMVLNRLEDFGPRCAELYGPVSMVIAHTSTGQHLPNVFDDANRIYAVPKGAQYTILYQDNSPSAYQVDEYPLDQSKLDWTVFRSEISERPSRNYGKVTAAFDIKPENIGQYQLSDLLGGATLTAEEAYDLLDMEPEQVRERVKTAADMLMYMLAGKMGDNGGCYCDLIDGQTWHSNFTAFKVMEQRLGNCGSFANLANYLLEGDYEEVGFILHGYYIGQGGGHVYNYIRHEGKYYIVDFSWYMFNGYMPENDFPVMVLNRLEDFGPRCAELYGPVSMVIAHTSTGQHLPNVFDDANRIYAVPKGAQYTILYQDNSPDAYQVGEYPLNQNKLDWTKFE
ncbi:MAG: hypothetical protein PUD38_00820 [Firmicutes bacterium]|nr:hypothetical protein [Bacillota bacterium]